jgi:hypothetical protein
MSRCGGRAYRTNKPVNVFYDAKAAKKTAERKARRAARRLKEKGRGHRRSKSEGGKAGASAASGGDTTDGGATSGSEGESLGRPCNVHAVGRGQQVGFGGGGSKSGTC